MHEHACAEALPRPRWVQREMGGATGGGGGAQRARVPRNGTSFAAPNVAGIVALIRERHPDATLEEVREVLRGLAEG